MILGSLWALFGDHLEENRVQKIGLFVLWAPRRVPGVDLAPILAGSGPILGVFCDLFLYFCFTVELAARLL